MIKGFEMTFEIERRFLIANDKWKEFVTHKTCLEQGYLSYDLNDWIIRIRSNGENFKITFKKHIKNFTNYEFEYLIPSNDGKEIFSTLKNTIKKERFFLKVDQKNWIIDSFKDKNFPLEIAEIELSKENEQFNMPDFLGKEITGLKIFSNLSLSNHPFSEWCNEDINNIKMD